MRGRELKPVLFLTGGVAGQSPAMRGRELKPRLVEVVRERGGRPPCAGVN